MKKPECWQFAMDFLGEPESKVIEDYVTALADEIERLRSRLAEVENARAIAEVYAIEQGRRLSAAEALLRMAYTALRHPDTVPLEGSIDAFLAEKPAQHWQCQKCGSTNTDPYCPCGFIATEKQP